MGVKAGRRKVKDERILLIEQQHRREGLLGESWTRERFNRFIASLHCQPEEIAARYFIPIGQLNRWIASDYIPPYVALHFVLLEKAFISLSKSVKEE